jgi:hypothetical protein
VNIARDGEVIAQRTLPSPTPAGIVRISLAELGATLETGVLYEWTLSVSPDPDDRSKDAVVGGGIKRVELPLDPNRSAPEQRLTALERAGLWYDALDLISTSIDKNPGAQSLLEHRSALLRVVGVDPPK